jgi:hypothetical protein
MIDLLISEATYPISLLAMKSGGEDSFQGDEDFSALNPALRFGKFF